jgi:WD40 repeat protein/predicted Ser/Thr protein kinase
MDPTDAKFVAAGDTSHEVDADGQSRTLGPLLASGGQAQAPNRNTNVDFLTVAVRASGDDAVDLPNRTATIGQIDSANAEEQKSRSTNQVGPAADGDLTVAVPGPVAVGDTKAALQSSVPPLPRERPLPTVAGYEILGELGRGGMGVVYRARQIRLNRPCVLKMILAGAHAEAESVLRFLAEAEAVARLQHPNIVQIHHVGEADGLPYFELEYVDGGSLDKALDGTPWPARRAAGLVESLASAVAEAHRLGIVHRDLKPANVLLAADGTPKIIDFGLAKSLAGDSGLTQTDSIMGSPGYMAPEQAQGNTREVGTLADVYALGVILYELLTGRRPFVGATVLETLEQVKATEPVAPSRLVPGLPRDVETIALKCLQKEPPKRYESAATLATDLHRFLTGEPIVARPIPVWERAWRWCRRHPAPAALTAAIVFVAALGLTGILWQWSEAVKARDLASKRALAEAAARREAETILVDMYATNGVAAGEQGEHARAVLWFANAARRAVADRDRRESNALRTQTWSRRALQPRHAVVIGGSWPGGLAFDPTGRYLNTADVAHGNDRIRDHRLWDLETEQSLPIPGEPKSVRAATWSPDGKTLALGFDDGDVVLTPFPSGDRLTRIPFEPRIRRLLFSRDGRYLAIAGGRSARVWDVHSGAFATPELIHPAVVTTVAFHPEGSFLATAAVDQQARLYAVPGDGENPVRAPVPHHQLVGTLWYREFGDPPLFVNDGRELITCSGSDLAWHIVGTGAEVRTQHFPDWSRGIASVELSPDGRYLAVFGLQSRMVRLVEVASGRVLGTVFEHKNTVMCAAFSPDSRMLATCSTDGTARLWSIPDGRSLNRPLDLHRVVHAVAFAPNGRALVTQDFGLVRLWSRPEEALPMSQVPLDGKSSLAVLSPDGALVMPAGMTFQGESTLKSTRVFHIGTCQPAGPPLRIAGYVLGAVFSPDGRFAAVIGGLNPPSPEAQDLTVWDWSSGRRLRRVVLSAQPRSVAYRPDGQRLAVLCESGELFIYDAGSGRELRRWPAHDAEPAHHWVNNGKVQFSPDGHSVLTWGMGNDLRVWDGETGRLRYPAVRHQDKCHDVQFSPDGRLIALASYDRSVRVRDFATAKLVAELPDHPDNVYSASFSPDGRLLVTACRDRSVRVWDWRSGQIVCPPFEHMRDAVNATFTPDGRWVLSASADGTTRVWDWRTGKPVTPPLTIEGEPLSVEVTPDGKHAVVGGGQRTIPVLDLSGLTPTTVDPESLCRWAELLSGQRIHDGGGTVNLSADEWLDRWRKSAQRTFRSATGRKELPTTKQ